MTRSILSDRGSHIGKNSLFDEGNPHRMTGTTVPVQRLPYLRQLAAGIASAVPSLDLRSQFRGE